MVFVFQPDLVGAAAAETERTARDATTPDVERRIQQRRGDRAHARAQDLAAQSKVRKPAAWFSGSVLVWFILDPSSYLAKV